MFIFIKKKSNMLFIKLKYSNDIEEYYAKLKSSPPCFPITQSGPLLILLFLQAFSKNIRSYKGTYFLHHKKEYILHVILQYPLL